VNRIPAAALCAAAALVSSVPARAAPPELFSEIALHPTDPDRIALAYVQGGQGLLFSSDGGHSFGLRCGSAVSSSFTKSRAPLWLTSGGEALLGTFEGLVRGSAAGCGFGTDDALAGLQVADFARDPRDAAVTFLATANARDGRATGLVRLGAEGVLTALGASDTGSEQQAAVSMNRLGVVARAEGGLRFYASALRADAAGDYHPIIRHSDDDGSSWVSFDVPGAEGARVLLIGVDPSDPERIAIALSRESGNDSVLVSADAGQSFEPRLEIFELGGSSVAPDGRLWVGDAGGEAEYSQPGGLYRFDDFGSPALKLATFPVRCLAFRAEPEQLFACQRSAFGRVDPATGDFTRLSSLGDVGGFVACEGEALAPACKAQLCDNWCGVLHYASAPLCDVYSEVSPLCGPAARGYGQAAPPRAGGLALPGDEPASPSPDAGGPLPIDANGSNGSTDDVAGPAGAPACRVGRTLEPASAVPAIAGVSLWLGLVLRRRARRCNPDPVRPH
jgi:hypothetical protein